MVVIANIKHFTYAHEITVVDDENNVIDTRQAAVGRLGENIIELCEQYDCNEVKINGNKVFASLIYKGIEEMGMAKYNRHIHVSLMSN